MFSLGIPLTTMSDMGYSISWMTPPLKKTDVSTDPPNILDVLVAYKFHQFFFAITISKHPPPPGLKTANPTPRFLFLI